MTAIFSFLYSVGEDICDVMDDKRIRERKYRAASLGAACDKMARYLDSRLERDERLFIWVDEEVAAGGALIRVPDGHNLTKFL